MKKTLAIILTLSLALSCFIGCGSSDTSTTDTSTGDTVTDDSSTEEDVVADEPVEMTTITVWCNSGSAQEVYEREIAEFNDTIGVEEGIYIDFTVQGSDYATILEAAISSDQMPDILTTPTTQMNIALSQDKLLYIDELPGGDEILAGLDEDDYITNVNEFDGRIISIPINTTTLGLLYNKDLFVAAGIVDENGEATPPETIDEMLEYAELITALDDSIYGISIPMAWSAWYNYDLIRVFTASNGQTDFNYETLEFDYEGIRSCFEYLVALADSGSYLPGAESLDNDQSRAYFAAGVVGMTFGASWDVGVLTSQFPAECDWGVAYIPVVDESESYGVFAEQTCFWKIAASAVTDENGDYDLAKAEKVEIVYEWFNSDELRITLYEEELFIPTDQELVDAADTSEMSEQWAEFADLTYVHFYNQGVSVSVDGNSVGDVLMEVFLGRVSIDDAIADLNERYNAALDEAVENGTIDLEALYDADTDELMLRD